MKLLKYFGLVGILVEYFGVVALLLLSNQSLELGKPISYYGTLAATSLIFSIIYALAGILFGLFGYWVYTKYQPRARYLVALLVAVVAQVSLSWLPDKGNTSGAHFYCALLVMITMPIMVIEFSKVAKNQFIRRFSRAVVLLELIAIPLLPVGSYLGYSLLPEALTVIAFQAWVVIVTLHKEPQLQ